MLSTRPAAKCASHFAAKAVSLTAQICLGILIDAASQCPYTAGFVWVTELLNPAWDFILVKAKSYPQVFSKSNLSFKRTSSSSGIV